MTANSIEAVFFDVDGVLIDSPDVHVRFWLEAFKPYNIDLPAQRLHLEEGRKSMDIARRIVRDYKLDLSDDKLEELIRWKREQYRLHSPSGMRSDALTAVRDVKANGWKVGLVSGSVKKNIMSVLSEGELSLFDVKITAESYKKSKPDPEPYLTACRKACAEQQNCIAIENAPLGIESAKAAGMKVVAITSTLPEALLKDADVIMNDLNGLAEVLTLIRR
ncbi:HAD family phosphatase [bacterium]|nr:HAD family phosphatase [bacterium]